jgi:CRISPR-associated protein Csm3
MSNIKNPTKLVKILKIRADIEILTGILIGAGDTEMHIGGADKTVIKNPVTNEPYLPGSSIKGKMRSLLEWKYGVIGETQGKVLELDVWEGIENAKMKNDSLIILQLFGFSPQTGKNEDLIKLIGPTRLSFWDAILDKKWIGERRKLNQTLTEVKAENSINRISGTADAPRFFERVPAGAKFNFTLAVKIFDTDDERDMLGVIKNGLRLIEMDSLGASGSRGYGKVQFTFDHGDKFNLDSVQPFEDESKQTNL